jgi:hypothetical protein
VRRHGRFALRKDYVLVLLFVKNVSEVAAASRRVESRAAGHVTWELVWLHSAHPPIRRSSSNLILA